MTAEEACERIIFHTQPEPDAFLGMLRPYQGLRVEVLRDLKASLVAVAPLLAEQQLHRDLVSALWGIAHLGRMWALEADGMLRRNGLINDTDLARLQEFLDNFGFAVFSILDGASETAFEDWQTDP